MHMPPLDGQDTGCIQTAKHTEVETSSQEKKVIGYVRDIGVTGR
jgi:hypothetical protein